MMAKNERNEPNPTRRPQPEIPPDPDADKRRRTSHFYGPQPDPNRARLAEPGSVGEPAARNRAAKPEPEPEEELDFDEDPAELLAGVDLNDGREVHKRVYQAQTAKYRKRFARAMEKYARGAGLLGLSGWEIDRILGQPRGRFRQDCTLMERKITIEPEKIAIYQAIIPLSREYLEAEDADSTPDDLILDMSPQRTPLNAILPDLVKIQAEAGVPSLVKFLSMIRDVVSLNEIGRPMDWIWEACEEKMHRDSEAIFERIRNRKQKAKGGEAGEEVGAEEG